MRVSILSLSVCVSSVAANLSAHRASTFLATKHIHLSNLLLTAQRINQQPPKKQVRLIEATPVEPTLASVALYHSLIAPRLATKAVQALTRFLDSCHFKKKNDCKDETMNSTKITIGPTSLRQIPLRKVPGCSNLIFRTRELLHAAKHVAQSAKAVTPANI